MLEECVRHREAGVGRRAPEAQRQESRRQRNAARSSAPSQRHSPSRIIADAPSSSTMIAAAMGPSGARPRCRISAMAPAKSKSLPNPPCR